MLMHQGIGLGRFNTMNHRQAVHALFECCPSVTWASSLADRRPYASYDDLFRAADAELGELSESDIDEALTGHPPICSRMNRFRSAQEQCAVSVSESEQAVLQSACAAYQELFGFRLLCVPAGRTAPDITAEIESRMLNDRETERKVMRNELARINHIRLERMLGPEEGYPLY
jgi:OHCU decarboxylase